MSDGDIQAVYVAVLRGVQQRDVCAMRSPGISPGVGRGRDRHRLCYPGGDRHKRTAGTMRTVNSELAELLDALEALDTSWCSLQQRWVGRYVMLTQPIDSLPSPGGGCVHVERGTLGVIVQVTHSRDAPFLLRFPGFPYRIAPLISHLVIMQEQSPVAF